MKPLPQSFRFLFVIAVLAAVGSAGCHTQAARKQTPSASPQTPPPSRQMPSAGGEGDVNSGKQIAASGAPNGVAACASCHGAQGEGNAASNFPRIAGQPQAYLQRQLTYYANGSRDNPVMAPIAKALTPQQISAVSAYYATLAAPSVPAPAAKAADQSMKRGQVLANIGDEKIGVQACANCHGPGGAGEPPLYPYLAAQHAGYTVAQLNQWKSGSRKTDASQQMPMIAKRLSDNDMTALASYFAAQPAPPPAAQRINVPPPAAAHPGAPAAEGGGAAQGGPPQPGVSGGATGAPPGATEKSRP
jgi:cytochrome c553